MREKSEGYKQFRKELMSDPYLPAYHFNAPSYNLYPADPNGAFFADGVYHLMFLYKDDDTDGYHWGHVSSIDLLHWRQHPDALTVYEGDRGCYSGGAFLDDDKTAYITFWKFPSPDTSKDNGGIAIAYSKPPYEKWERIEPIAISQTEWGINDVIIDGTTVHLGCADPSNIWKMNGHYYMQLGNLCVLNKYGRSEDSDPRYRGGWTELYRSDDLKNWEFVHRFYDAPQIASADLPDDSEDDMCPSFLPLFDAKSDGKFTGKYLQLFISHNKGCQYFIGSLKGEKFIPESHGRMSWKNHAFFAPEALIDDKNRHIMWAWLHENLAEDYEKYGWSGVYSFPRVLWLEDGTLKMSPAEELDSLQYSHFIADTSNDDIFHICDICDDDMFRIKASWEACGSKAGIRVKIGKDGEEYTDIYYSPEEKALVMDTLNSGIGTKKIRECAPFDLGENETLSLDIFVDRSIVEVYANERQAICRRAFSSDPFERHGVKIFGDCSRPTKLEAWRIFPSQTI